MPSIRTLSLSFTFPDDWSTFVDGDQQIAHGPNEEEVIVSGATVEGSGSDSELQEVLRATKARAIESMCRTAAHPDLMRLAAVEERKSVEDVTVLRLRCVSIDRTTRFDQFALLAGRDVVLLTYEAPTSTDSLALVEEVVYGARRL